MAVIVVHITRATLETGLPVRRTVRGGARVAVTGSKDQRREPSRLMSMLMRKAKGSTSCGRATRSEFAGAQTSARSALLKEFMVNAAGRAAVSNNQAGADGRAGCSRNNPTVKAASGGKYQPCKFE